MRRVCAGASFRSFAYVAALIVVCACTSDPGYKGKSSDAMIAELKEGNRSIRIDAAFGLKKVLEIRPDYPEVVSALAGALQDTSDAVRLAAAHALTVPGVDIQPALDGIHAAIHDTAHAETRRTIAMTIGTLGPDRATPLIPALIEALGDPSAEVRKAAVESLGMLGSITGRELPALSNLAVDSSPDVRRAVFHSLINLHSKPEAVLQVARRGVFDPSSGVREAAVLLLATFGVNASAALPELERALADQDARVVLAALFAIEAMGVTARSVQPKLAALVTDTTPAISRAASRALASARGSPLPPPEYAEPLLR